MQRTAAMLKQTVHLYLAERVADRVARGLEDTVSIDDLAREIDARR
jgi:hypothetical protein